MKGCPSREQLANLIGAEFAETQRSEIGAHAQSCPKCRQIMDELTLREAPARGGRPRPGPEPPATQRWGVGPEPFPTWPVSPPSPPSAPASASPGETVDMPDGGFPPLEETHVGTDAGSDSPRLS